MNMKRYLYAELIDAVAYLWMGIFFVASQLIVLCGRVFIILDKGGLKYL